MSANKIIGYLFFKKVNPECSIKLIIAPLFMELTQDEELEEIYFY